MRAYRSCSGAVLVAACFVGASAHAQYRCDPAPSRVDKAACVAAEQGPRELRHYVERMRSISTPILFHDYVNEARARAWDDKERRERLAKEAERVPLPEVARAAPQ